MLTMIPRSGPHHDRKHGAQHVERAADIDINVAPPLVGVGLPDRRKGDEAAGIVEHEIGLASGAE